MLSGASNPPWIKTPPSHCYSWRILWLFLLFCSRWLGDSARSLPAKQRDHGETRTFLTPTYNQRTEVTPHTPQKWGVAAVKQLGQKEEATKEGLAVDRQPGIAPLAPGWLGICWSSANAWLLLPEALAPFPMLSAFKYRPDPSGLGNTADPIHVSASQQRWAVSKQSLLAQLCCTMQITTKGYTN